MAWRNVWRNRRRSLVTIAAMSFALLVMITWAGLATGYLRDTERAVVGAEVGDLQIFAPGFVEDPALSRRIDDADDRVARLEAAGYGASARLLGGGLAACGARSFGVSLRGVDPARDARVLGLDGRVTEGAWLDAGDADGVVLGAGLARTFAAGPGATVRLRMRDAGGRPAEAMLRVRGVLGPIAEATDGSAVFLLSATFRRLAAVPSGAHQIVVRRPAGLDLDAAAAAVRGAEPDLDVRTWRELMPTVATMLEGTAAMLQVMFLVLDLAVAILILNAMLMAVFERVREFGVLKALGTSPLRVFATIAAESAIQTAAAAAVGGLLAIPIAWFLAAHGVNVGSLGGVTVAGVAMQPVWYGVYSADSFVRPVATMAFVVLLAVLYPAFKAAWVRPTTAMRQT
jgi:ABC-type lipoprotein release transport system permease subunit